MHGIMFFSTVGIFWAFIITVITEISGYLMGYINERYSDGSIISSWMLHGTVNTLASIISMFNVLEKL